MSLVPFRIRQPIGSGHIKIRDHTFNMVSDHSDGSEFIVIFQTPLALLIDPYKYDGEKRKAIFFTKSAVTLMAPYLGDTPRAGDKLYFPAYIYFDSSVSKEACDASLSEGIPFDVVNLSNAPVETLERKFAAVSDGEGRRLITVSQSAAVALSLSALVDHKKYEICQEISLDSVVCYSLDDEFVNLRRAQLMREHEYAKGKSRSERKTIEPIVRSQIQEEVRQFESYLDFFHKTSLDLVLLDKDDFKPVFAVEYDGGQHQSLHQQRKDEIKNHICEISGLPLIRITSPYLPPDEERYTYKDHERIERDVRSSLMQSVVMRVDAYEEDLGRLDKELMISSEKFSTLPELERMQAEGYEWFQGRQLIDDMHMNQMWITYELEMLGDMVGGQPRLEYVERGGAVMGHLSLQGNKVGLSEAETFSTPFWKIKGVGSILSCFENLPEDVLASYLLNLAKNVIEDKT